MPLDGFDTDIYFAPTLFYYTHVGYKASKIFKSSIFKNRFTCWILNSMFYRSEKIVEGCGDYKKGIRFEFQTSIEKSRGNEAGQIEEIF